MPGDAEPHVALAQPVQRERDADPRHRGEHAQRRGRPQAVAGGVREEQYEQRRAPAVATVRPAARSAVKNAVSASAPTPTHSAVCQCSCSPSAPQAAPKIQGSRA